MTGAAPADGETGSGPDHVDAVVVGAGFAGMYQLLLLRRAGYSAVVIEAGTDVGGTWYWNRYPGARCDVPSMEYSYSFDDELQQSWDWSEIMSPQPEILAYARHVADRFDLRRDIRFATRVTAATFDAGAGRWLVTTDRGHDVSARFCIMATGCLSVSNLPDIDGRDSFAGPVLHTGDWPKEPVDFTGLRVGVIGTGSSAIQSIPCHRGRRPKNWSCSNAVPAFSLPGQVQSRAPDGDERDVQGEATPRSGSAIATLSPAISGFNPRKCGGAVGRPAGGTRFGLRASDDAEPARRSLRRNGVADVGRASVPARSMQQFNDCVDRDREGQRDGVRNSCGSKIDAPSWTTRTRPRRLKSHGASRSVDQAPSAYDTDYYKPPSTGPTSRLVDLRNEPDARRSTSRGAAAPATRATSSSTCSCSPPGSTP